MTDQEATNTRAAARMTVLANDAGDLLEILGLLPGQAIDAPTQMSTGFFNSSGAGPRGVLWRVGRAS